MDFRIADTFTDSLARLTGDEQKAVKTTAFDLQLDPANPAMSFHKLGKARDKRFWKAYAWAERRKLETHLTTGAAQLVEIRERVQEIVVPAYAQAPRTPAPKKPLLAHVLDAELLGYGVPAEWLADVRQATEDTVLALADHLPAEAAEALLELATGGTPYKARPAPPVADPFDHPDARRRFRVVADVDELARALEYPWERWTVFLHPAQRELVERHFGGPARIAGSAGTGKTVVALHRAAYLARANLDARILLTTFSETLASALRTKLVRLIGTEPRLRERIDVDALDAVAHRLHDRMLGRAEVASRDVMRHLVREAAGVSAGQKFSLPFLSAEWKEVVDAWQLGSWEAYRDVARLGRKTRLPERQRQALWGIFERVRTELGERKLVTQADLYSRLATHLAAGERPPYDFVVVDEAQDVSVAVTRRGHPRPIGDAAHQLPDVAPDQVAGRSAAGKTRLRRGRQHGGAGRHDLGVQRGGPAAARARRRRGRIRAGGLLAGGARGGGGDARGNGRLRPVARRVAEGARGGGGGGATRRAAR
jgi:hypothetical protein